MAFVSVPRDWLNVYVDLGKSTFAMKAIDVHSWLVCLNGLNVNVTVMLSITLEGSTGCVLNRWTLS